MNKILHYCWFGNNKKSDIIIECMETWKKFFPDYEIIEWNETNFDVHCCRYVEEAYNSKKWAFVSDYCRFWALYKYGGIYLDTDVKIIRSFEGLPLCFVGFESQNAVASGLVRAASKGDEVCKLMLESYHSDSFLLSNGELNLKTVCQRETEILGRFGLQLNNEMQEICNTVVFPKEYFCPLDFATGRMNITSNTYSIHMYGGSWHTPQQEYATELRKKLSKILPNGLAARLAYVISILKYHGIKKTLKMIISKICKTFGR